jgi:hypothetical protein
MEHDEILPEHLALLIKLDAKLDSVVQTISEIKSQLASKAGLDRLLALETKVTDIERRVSQNERLTFMGV